MGKTGPNPGWTNGQYRKGPESNLTAFEIKAAELDLAPEEYVSSGQLRAWAQAHKNHRYIPENLLAAWSIEVNAFASPGLRRGINA